MWNKLFKKLQSIVFSRFYTRTKVVIYQYKNSLPIRSALVLIPVNEQNIQDARQFEDPVSFSINTKNFKKGEKGIYGYLNNHCVFRAWIIEGPKKILLHKFYTYQLKENEIYIHSCETAANHRGKGFYPYAISTIAAKYRSEGKKILISTDEKNISSKKGILKAGFEEKFIVSVNVFLGFKKIRASERE